MQEVSAPDGLTSTLVAFDAAREGSVGNRKGAAMGVRVGLLGGFGVARDDTRVAADAWGRRQAAQLVQVLALARDRRMHREQVIDALWPGLSWDTAGPRLHKAAHYARRALDDPGAVVLRHELVALFPGRDDVEVDVHEFTRTASQALRTGDEELATEALRWYAGPLLPDDPYQAWTDEPRRAARQQHLDLLRLLGRWDELLAHEPADEDAHLALASARVAADDPRGRFGPARAARAGVASGAGRLAGRGGRGPAQRARAEHGCAQRTAVASWFGGRRAGCAALWTAKRRRGDPRRPRRGGRRTWCHAPWSRALREWASRRSST